MPDRLQEIRERLDAWHGMEPVEQSLTHPDEYVADIAWLLDEVERLKTHVNVANVRMDQQDEVIARLREPVIEVRGHDGSVWVRVDGLTAPKFRSDDA